MDSLVAETVARVLEDESSDLWDAGLGLARASAPAERYSVALPEWDRWALLPSARARRWSARGASERAPIPLHTRSYVTRGAGILVCDPAEPPTVVERAVPTVSARPVAEDSFTARWKANADPTRLGRATEGVAAGVAGLGSAGTPPIAAAPATAATGPTSTTSTTTSTSAAPATTPASLVAPGPAAPSLLALRESLAIARRDKSSLKRHLRQLDREFQQRTGREPRKEDKEHLRPQYQRYRDLKVRIAALERQIMAVDPTFRPEPDAGDRGGGDDDDDDKDGSDLTALGSGSHAAPAGPASAGVGVGGVHGSGAVASHSTHGPSAAGPVSTSTTTTTTTASSTATSAVPADLEAVKREKRALQQRLRAFEDEFRAKHNRGVKFRRDIEPVADAYARYKQLKRILQDAGHAEHGDDAHDGAVEDDAKDGKDASVGASGGGVVGGTASATSTTTSTVLTSSSSSSSSTATTSSVAASGGASVAPRVGSWSLGGVGSGAAGAGSSSGGSGGISSVGRSGMAWTADSGTRSSGSGSGSSGGGSGGAGSSGASATSAGARGSGASAGATRPLSASAVPAATTATSTGSASSSASATAGSSVSAKPVLRSAAGVVMGTGPARDTAPRSGSRGR